MHPTQTLIARLWQQNLPKVLDHLGLLDRAANTAPLPEPLRLEALATAHKLAGSLGMYGYPAGTDHARQLEQTLDQPNPDPATLQRLTHSLRQSLDKASSDDPR